MASRLVLLDQSLRVIDRTLQVRKADPSIFSEAGFIQEVLKEANEIRKVVGDNVDKVMSRVKRSANVNWAEATSAQKTKIVRELGNLIKGLPSQFSPGVSVVLDERGKVVNQKTKKALNKKHRKISVETTFNQVDQAGVEALRETTSVFFGQEYEKQADRFRTRAQKTIADGLEKGFGRREIARDLSNEFRDSAIHEHYWTTVAAVHTNRARSFSSAATFIEAGITQYEILAVQDERTTPICRFMDGKVFSVGEAVGQFEAFEAAEDLDEVRNRVMPFMRVKGGEIVLPSGRRVAEIGPKGFKRAMNTKKLNAAGIHMPPYHFGCRTTVVPVL